MNKPDSNQPDASVTGSSLTQYTLPALWEYCKTKGLIDPDEDLTPHRIGRSRKAGDNPVDQLAAMEFETKEGVPTFSVDQLYAELAKDFGLAFERIDSLTIDTKLVTSMIGRSFAEKRLIIPLRKEGAKTIIGIANPLDEDAVQTVSQLVSGEVELRLVLPSDLYKITREFYGLRQSLSKAGIAVNAPVSSSKNLEQLLRVRSDKELEQSDQHVINAVEYLFRYGIDQQASDIHFEPKRTDGIVRLRIDGIMHTIHQVPMQVYRALVSRIKTISRMDIAERRMPQDGRIKLTGFERDIDIEMRVSTLPVVFGEKVVLRIFDPKRVVHNFLDLGFTIKEDALMQTMLSYSHGMILVTGPTGSGKSTTMYCALRQLAQQPVNIVSIEDPVEMIIEELNQVAVQPNIHLGFAEALRTILRQDPDIIMVGEIRDSETARYAVQAALTGHLLLSTLHTNDTFTAIGRLLDLGIDRFFIAQVLRGITAQRLIRTVCPVCSEEHPLTAAQTAALGKKLEPGWTFQKGSGCEQCRGTGYKGRTTLNEMILVTREISELIYEKAPRDVILAAATKTGYQSLEDAALAAILEGRTTPDEAIRVATVGAG